MDSAEKQPSEPSPTEGYDFTVTLADGENAIAYHLWLPQDDGADGFIMCPPYTYTLHLVPYEALQYALALLGVNQPTNTEEEGNSWRMNQQGGQSVFPSLSE